MRKTQKLKLMILASAAMVAIPVVAAMAASTSVTVTANFRKAISVTSGTDLNFSKIDYSSNAVTASDYVTVGTNSSVTYAGGNFAGGSGAVTTAGDVQVVTGDPLAVWVECSTTATLANGSNTIQATGIEVTTVGGATTYGSGNACLGAGSPAMGFTLVGGGAAADHIKVGGKLDGSTASGGTIVSGAYSTANAGGSPVIVDIYYQ